MSFDCLDDLIEGDLCTPVSALVNPSPDPRDALIDELVEALRQAQDIVMDRSAGGRMLTTVSAAEIVRRRVKTAIDKAAAYREAKK